MSMLGHEATIGWRLKIWWHCFTHFHRMMFISPPKDKKRIDCADCQEFDVIETPTLLTGGKEG